MNCAYIRIPNRRENEERTATFISRGDSPDFLWVPPVCKIYVSSPFPDWTQGHTLHVVVTSPYFPSILTGSRTFLVFHQLDTFSGSIINIKQQFCF